MSVGRPPDVVLQAIRAMLHGYLQFGKFTDPNALTKTETVLIMAVLGLVLGDDPERTLLLTEVVTRAGLEVVEESERIERQSRSN